MFFGVGAKAALLLTAAAYLGSNLISRTFALPWIH
jgi:hypothetical protein